MLKPWDNLIIVLGFSKRFTKDASNLIFVFPFSVCEITTCVDCSTGKLSLSIKVLRISGSLPQDIKTTDMILKNLIFIKENQFDAATRTIVDLLIQHPILNTSPLLITFVAGNPCFVLYGGLFSKQVL